MSIAIERLASLLEFRKEIVVQFPGKSRRFYATVSIGEARNPPTYSWFSAFARQAGIGLAVTLAVTFAVYALVRAIGWVISGFAAA